MIPLLKKSFFIALLCSFCYGLAYSQDHNDLSQTQFFFKNVFKTIEKGCTYKFEVIGPEYNKIITNELIGDSLVFDLGYSCEILTPILFDNDLLNIYGDRKISDYIKGFRKKNANGDKITISDLVDGQIQLYGSKEKIINDISDQETLISYINKSKLLEDPEFVKWIILSMVYEKIIRKNYRAILVDNFPMLHFTNESIPGVQNVKIFNYDLKEYSSLFLAENPGLFYEFDRNNHSMQIYIHQYDDYLLAIGKYNTSPFYFYLSNPFETEPVIRFLLFETLPFQYVRDENYHTRYFGEYEDEYFNKTTIYTEKDKIYIHQYGRQKEIVFITKSMIYVKNSSDFITFLENEESITLVSKTRIIGTKFK